MNTGKICMFGCEFYLVRNLTTKKFHKKKLKGFRSAVEFAKRNKIRVSSNSDDCFDFDTENESIIFSTDGLSMKKASEILEKAQ